MTVSGMLKQLTDCAPTVFELLRAMVMNRNVKKNKKKTAEVKMMGALAALTVLLHTRNQKASDLPTMFGVFSMMCGASVDCINTFSKLGFSCSYETVRAYLHKLAAQPVVRKLDEVRLVVRYVACVRKSFLNRRLLLFMIAVQAGHRHHRQLRYLGRASSRPAAGLHQRHHAHVPASRRA